MSPPKRSRRALSADVGLSARPLEPLPSDRMLLRKLWHESINRMRFYQSFLKNRIGTKPIQLLDVYDAIAIQSRANDGGQSPLVPGFEVCRETYMSPSKGRAKPGILGMVERYLSEAADIERIKALEIIKEACNCLHYRATPHEFLRRFRMAIGDRDRGLHRVIAVYEQLANAIQQRLEKTARSPNIKGRKKSTGAPHGRPAKTNRDADWLGEWQRNQYKTKAAFAAAKGVSADVMRKALKRAERQRPQVEKRKK